MHGLVGASLSMKEHSIFSTLVIVVVLAIAYRFNIYIPPKLS